MIFKNTSEKLYENNGNYPVLSCIGAGQKIVLDIGFGNGANAGILKKLGHVIDGITLSSMEANAARDVMRNIYIHNLELGLPLEITEKYDVIICSHVLEHIAYPAKLLSDIQSKLSPGGILTVALPNLMNYRFRWELLKGNFPSHESGIWDNTHLRWYTFTSGSELFENNGFVVKKAFVTGDVPFLRLTRKIPVRLRQKIYSLLTKISKGFFGVQLLYVLEKK